VDKNENIYTTGSFEGTVDFSSGMGTNNHISNGYNDAYILKLNTLVTGIKNINNSSNIKIYPNPTTGSINIELEETKSNINLHLTNAIGQVILTKSYKSTNYINLEIDTPKGLYLLQLESDGKIITKKIVKE